MKPKLIIAAANGFIGKSLINSLSPHYDLVGLVRKAQADTDQVRYVLWDGRTVGAWAKELEAAKAVINLAGRSISCRHNEQNKRDILQSRLESTQAIGDGIRACKIKPTVWLNCSSITIYQHSYTEPQDETATQFSEGFTTEVCKAWEAAFHAYQEEAVRQITLRISVVLGKKEGALKPLVPITKLGLGGRSGSGKQMFSWIHIQDFCSIIQFLIETESCRGVYNMCSPNPVTNDNLMKGLRKVLHQPIGIPQPEWAIRLGAKIIGTEAELVLESLYVLPYRLQQLHYPFAFPTLEHALQDLVG